MGCKKDPQRHIKQLQTNPCGSMNCGWSGTAMAVSSISCNWKNPGPNDIRMHVDGTTDGCPGSNPYDWRDGIEWYTAQKMGDSWEGGLDATVRKPGTHAQLRDWLEAGKAAVVGLDYGVYNDTGAPTGDPNYRGYHGVLLFGFREQGADDIRQVKSWDSLFDGRRSDVAGPGPVWVKWSKMREAMTAYANDCGYKGSDLWYGIEAKPGQKAEDQSPPPEEQVPEPAPAPDDPCPDCPPDPCAEAVAIARDVSRVYGYQVDPRELRDVLMDIRTEAMEAGDLELAERIRQAFRPDETWADIEIGPGVEAISYEEAAHRAQEDTKL